MTVEYVRDLDVAQGYSSTPDTHRPYGRIVRWTIGDAVIAPDVKVTDPGDIAVSRTVAVLSHVGWSTSPNQNITLRGRISPANTQMLRQMPTQSLSRAITSIAVVVYEYDPVGKAYYPSFSTYAGTPPTTSTRPQKPGGGFGADAIPAIYARFDQTSGTELGIKLANVPSADPVGIENFALEVTLAPPVAASPPRLRLQSSVTVKRIQPWGLPKV